MVRVLRLAAAVLTLVFTVAVLAFLIRMEVLRSGTKKYVFVDGGAHLGESTADFLSSPLGRWYPWEVYAFEANPFLIPEIPRRPYTTTLNQAVWIERGTVEFYVGKSSLSSSVHGHKKTGELSKVPVVVESVDLGHWLEGRFTEEDRVIVKLDIEGAEYEVLDKMLEDGTIRLVDELLVEFHNQKVGVDRSVDERLRTSLRERGIPFRGAVSLAHGDWFPPRSSPD